jgi:RNA methyltransferase, TrmH family
MPHPAGTTARNIAKGKAALITSRENRWIKKFRAALCGELVDEGIVGVEGVRLVSAALGSRLPVEALLVSESAERQLSRMVSHLATAMFADGRPTPLLRTSDKLFAGVTDTQAPQGIAALVRPRRAAIEDLTQGLALVVVLAGVQDPGNVGTIIRAADAFGATGVATCAARAIGTADPFGPKAVRASAGSALRLPIAHGVSAAILLAQLRASGVKVHAAVTPTSYPPSPGSGARIDLLRPWDVDWGKPAAILIGNEGAGLPHEFVEAADMRVYIPQTVPAGRIGVESLNAAMAASVLLYEVMRQRAAAEVDSVS